MEMRPFTGAFLPWEDDVAARELEDELSDHPRWADTANRTGLLRFLRGDLEGAVSAFRVALAENPRYGWAQLNLVAALHAKGAGEESRRLLVDLPDPAPGARPLTEGWLALLDGRPGAAMAALRRLPAPLRGRSDVRGLERALGTHRPVILLPGFHELWRWTSLHQVHRELPNLARHSADRMEQHWAEPGIALNHRAQLAAHTGDEETALRCYGAALSAAPDDPTAPAALAQRALRNGDPLRARRLLAMALRRAPGYADLHRRMGVLEARLGNDEAALVCFRRALTINPLYMRARQEEAGALARLGMWPEATRRLSALPASRPGASTWGFPQNGNRGHNERGGAIPFPHRLSSKRGHDAR